MLKIVLGSKRFFLLGTMFAIALRMIFVLRFPSVTTDSFIYGDIARNWLQHGIYGVSSAAGVLPTYIRLPGYPAFLAVIFAIFGTENYRAVLVVQMFVDVGTCFLVANLARKVFGDGAWKAGFLLSALCPFTANYAATALTETWEIFFTALSLNFALTGLKSVSLRNARPWIVCGLATAAAILLRPDGGILLAAILFFLTWLLARQLRNPPIAFAFAQAAFIVGLAATVPLLPWTLRNLHTMHRIQPLAPRYANEEGEFVPVGFNRWVKTWIADYVSVEEIYWPIPGESIDFGKLPNRAFDSPQQRANTLQLITAYNSELQITPELDAQFASLASARVKQATLRYYGWLPALRIADMWIRPRTEMLPADSRWWEFNDDPKGACLAVGFGLVGIFYVVAGMVGLSRRKAIGHAGLLITFVVMRSLFLGTLENPEPRYTLECYPVLIVFAAAAFRSRQTIFELPG